MFGAGGTRYWRRCGADFLVVCGPGIGVCIRGAGGADGWRRCGTVLAQVVAFLGAGEVFGWGPAPQTGFLGALVAQVTPLFPHLRHKHPTPAPRDTDTCARYPGDLR